MNITPDHYPIPVEDLDHVLDRTEDVWEALRGQRLFITGGTGFFGCWLLETFAHANHRLRLGAEALVLSRDPAAFQTKAPHLFANPAIRFHTGDVGSFDFPEGTYSHVIHAATDSGRRANLVSPLQRFETIVSGTRRVLEFAVQAGAHKFLLTSSGSVYGKQPSALPRIPEDYHGAPDSLDPAGAYGEGKRAAEMLCALYSRRYGLETKIARGFAFVGPHLPLDAHFAVGNFIRDALRGVPIEIKGDGTAQRSYLYAADLTVWLWKILVYGQSCRPYNVGSEEAVTIAELAAEVRDAVRQSVEVRIACRARPGAPAERYVPDTTRARSELGLEAVIGLSQAIQRTAAWWNSTKLPLPSRNHKPKESKCMK